MIRDKLFINCIKFQICEAVDERFGMHMTTIIHQINSYHGSVTDIENKLDILLDKLSNK